MITNFEEITAELTDYELSLVNVVILGMKLRTINNPIKSESIVQAMKEKGYKITGERLRKIINYIRSNSLLPIIGTSRGYYTSNDKDEILKQINSLNERANSIQQCAEGLQRFIKLNYE